MKAILACTGVALLLSLPASAATIADQCNGTVAIVRFSTLKHDSTRAAFNRAVADQIKWYRDQGITANRIVTADVMMNNGVNGPGVSTTQVMTIHYDPPQAAGKVLVADDGYKAFVSEFRAASDITSETEVCLPK